MRRIVAACALPRLPSSCLGASIEVDTPIGIIALPPGDVVRPVLRLLDANDAARAQGVRAGQRILDAQLHAPSLVVRTVDPARLHDELHARAEALLVCSPVVQPLPADAAHAWPCACILVDLTGIPRPIPAQLSQIARLLARLDVAGDMAGDPAGDLAPRVAVVAAPTTRLASACARALAVRARLPEPFEVRDVDRALSRLPLEALPLSSSTASSLRAIGAVTAADLLQLLDRGLVQRLGDEARAVVQTLRREDDIDDVIEPLRVPELLVEHLVLEDPIEALQPLCFVLNRLAIRLVQRLRGRSEALAEITVALQARRAPSRMIPIAFPSPILDDATLLRALQTRLEREGLQHRVDAVSLLASRTVARAPRQLDWQRPADVDDRLRGRAHTPDAVARLLAELSGELGAARVGCLVSTSSPLPEHMSDLRWPVPPDEPSAAPRRRRPRPIPLDPRTSSGRFQAGWPWPLRMLAQPLLLDATTSIARAEAWAVLSGDDGQVPWQREYRVLTLVDGRRALGLWDDETSSLWVQGWFD